MSLALYDPDRERAQRKRAELLETRESGGWYMELGPMGHVTYSEWTCEWCGQTLTDCHATTRPAFHRLDCPERPHPDQTGLRAFADGGGG